MRGVVPQSSFASMFALNLISSLTASVEPFSATQWRREALVAGSTSLGLPPFSRSDLNSCQIYRGNYTYEWLAVSTTSYEAHILIPRLNPSLHNVTDKLGRSLGKRLEAQRTANQVMVIDKCRKERAKWSGSRFLQLITEFHLFL